MEGPSLLLAEQQLKPFVKKTIIEVSGNTKIGKERLLNREIKDIFSWGKHLVFQFDDFAMRVHFMLFGTFEAEVGGVWVTGDYRKSREPRLSIKLKNGIINMYSCSIKIFEDKDIKKSYDFSLNIMSPNWDSKKAFINSRIYPEEEIADVLLDQTVFAGVGNMIKNEVLSIVQVNPKSKIKDTSDEKLRQIIEETKKFSLQFFEWRREFKLRENLKVHRKGKCPHCGEKLVREKTGKRLRWSYYCSTCQPLAESLQI